MKKINPVKILLVIGISILFLVTGCSNQKINTDIMPSIVFIHEVTYPDSESSRSKQLSFFDSEGNYYIVTDDNKTSMSAEELSGEYEKGELSDSIKLVADCNAGELKTNYQKLCGLAGNKNFALEEFEDVPAVEANVYKWYGIYLQGDKPEKILFYKEDCAGVHKPNDKTASEIFEWIHSSVSK